MNIVVLDGYTLNPGDLDWSGLEKLGNLVVFERTPANLITERCSEADAVFTNKTPLGSEIINQLNKLKFIGVLATGYNVVDISAASQKGIIVSNVPGYGTESVAQFTFALILELCHRVQRHSDSVFEGKWVRSIDFSYSETPLLALAGKTLGLIGFGDIGQKVADIAAAFDMSIIVNSRTRKEQTRQTNLKWVDLDELLAESDIVSLHCPLLPETHGLINLNRLSLMKESAFLINTARGPLIAEDDLALALGQGMIAGAALDVLSSEPPSIDNPLLSAPNCIITPHIAWATRDARANLMQIAVRNLAEFIQGRPVNIVNT